MKIRNIIAGFSLCIWAVACGGSHHGGKGGGGGSNPPPPPKETRFTLEEMRARQRTLASAAKLHPADKAGQFIRQMALGGHPGIDALPLNYWDADIAWRVWAYAKATNNAAEVGRCQAWFENWLRGRAGEWAGYPSGSQNHTYAQVLGAYAAVQVLGQARANAVASGVAKNAVADMRRLVFDGVWPCCGAGHSNDRGEIVGSRHYQVRTWSDLSACADLCEPDIAKRAGEHLDSAVAYLRGKVRADGVWPEDTVPQVRPERDAICYWPPLNKANEWPDPAIRRKYPELNYHPSFTPYTSFLVLDYVTKVNPDFIGHVKETICKTNPSVPCCSNTGGQSPGCDDSCDERWEINNWGIVLAGDKWRPLKGK